SDRLGDRIAALPMQPVDPAGLPRGDFETNRRHPRPSSLLRLVGRERATGTGIARSVVARTMRRLRGSLHLGARAEAFEGAPLGEQLLDCAGESIESLRLAVGPMRPKAIGPLVPVDSEPAQIFEDALLGARNRAWTVEVLDANQIGPSLGPRSQP